jgi:tRNA-dihydrouridine synthase 3
VGLATSFLSGSKEEWSLVRRHPSEKIFGVQLAGNKPTTLVPTAEVVASVCEDGNGVDFVDLNCGCPIDLVFKTGSGSASKSFYHPIPPSPRYLVVISWVTGNEQGRQG